MNQHAIPNCKVKYKILNSDWKNGLSAEGRNPTNRPMSSDNQDQRVECLETTKKNQKFKITTVLKSQRGA